MCQFSIFVDLVSTATQWVSLEEKSHCDSTETTPNECPKLIDLAASLIRICRRLDVQSLHACQSLSIQLHVSSGFTPTKEAKQTTRTSVNCIGVSHSSPLVEKVRTRTLTSCLTTCTPPHCCLLQLSLRVSPSIFLEALFRRLARLSLISSLFRLLCVGSFSSSVPGVLFHRLSLPPDSSLFRLLCVGSSVPDALFRRFVPLSLRVEHALHRCRGFRVCCCRYHLTATSAQVHRVTVLVGAASLSR